MPRGIVYILTNPCLDGWVKIGMTNRNDIKTRLGQLNTPANLPLSYRAYALYRVNDPQEVEKSIHRLIDMVDDSLHARETLASGRIREREFFQITPERAFSILKEVAKLRGDLDALELVERTEEEQEEEEVAAHRRPKFSFKMLAIPVGSELSFIRDDTITCTVVDEDNAVEYEGEVTTLSNLGTRLLRDLYGWKATYSVQGPLYFTYNGEALSDIRERLESSD